jgi:phosphoglycerate dehydrogenase-like enzyme
MNPIVIQTENLPLVCSDWLSQRCDLHICPADSLRCKELLPSAEALVIRTYTTVDSALLDCAPNLKVVGRAGVGVDNINLDACKKRGVTVVHTPDANTDSVVEFVLTTMLANKRNLHTVSTGLHQTEWNALRDASLTPKEFSETTLGIIGFGRIGSRLGKLARNLGFNVLFHDLLQISETHNCVQVGAEQLLAESDIVSIHVDGRKENTHLCTKEMFSLMANDVLFINASRGFVVDAYALADFLSHNPNSSAILDVHDPEPIHSEYPLLHLANATLYPHIACKTKTAAVNMGWVVKDIFAVLSGEQPLYEVNK